MAHPDRSDYSLEPLPPGVALDPLAGALCYGCGCWFDPDNVQDRKDHAAYHRLVVVTREIPYTPPGRGPLRMLSDEIRKAHNRRRRRRREERR